TLAQLLGRHRLVPVLLELLEAARVDGEPADSHLRNLGDLEMRAWRHVYLPAAALDAGARPTGRPSCGPGVLRLHEQQDDGDDEHEEHQGLDEGEAQDHRGLDAVGIAGLARHRVYPRALCPALA